MNQTAGFTLQQSEIYLYQLTSAGQMLVEKDISKQRLKGKLKKKSHYLILKVVEITIQTISEILSLT
jgi:hypothetical protein